MPTDLPPDYKPRPKPGEGKAPSPVPQPQGDDVNDKGPATGGPSLPGEKKGDVVNPPGWKEPARGPDSDPLGVPTPAGTPTFWAPA